MPIEVFGQMLFSGLISEYLFATIFSCAAVNLVTSPLSEKIKAHFTQRMIGRNHDIRNAMETAFQCAVKGVFQEWEAERKSRSLISGTAKTPVSKAALKCRDSLLKDRGKILFGNKEDALDDEKIRHLLLPENLTPLDAKTIRETKAEANRNFMALIEPHIADAPGAFQALLRTKLLDKTVFFFREMFKGDQRVFDAVMLDDMNELRRQMAGLKEMLTIPPQNIDNAVPGDGTIILESVVALSELWVASDDKLEGLIARLEVWKVDISARLGDITTGIKSVDEKVEDVRRILTRFEELQKPTPGDLAAIRRQIEELRHEQIQEGRHRQTSRRKSVGTMRVERLFVDREAYLDRLAEYVADENIHLILIAGHGGFGKTALAAKFCEGIEKAKYQLCCGETVLPIRGGGLCEPKRDALLFHRPPV